MRQWYKINSRRELLMALHRISLFWSVLYWWVFDGEKWKKRKPAASTAKKRTRKFVFISTAADIFLSVFFFYFPIFINKAFGFCLGQSSSEVEKNILLFLSSLCSSLNKQKMKTLQRLRVSFWQFLFCPLTTFIYFYLFLL